MSTSDADASHSPLHQWESRFHWGPSGWLGVGAAIVVFFLLAIAFPEADPPSSLPGLRHIRSPELFIEPAAKAHEARNWALFGEWHRNPADNYQFWRVQSPVWVYPLALMFRVLGTSYGTLHLYSALIGGVGLVGLAAVLRQFAPAWIATIAMWLYGTNLFVVLIGRSGLIEVLLNALAPWLVYCIARGREHPGWLVASQAVFTLGFFGKQGMVFLFPLLVAGNVWAFLGSRDANGRRPWLAVASAALIALGSAVWIAGEDYQRTLAHNIPHLLAPGEDAGFVDRFELFRLWMTTVVNPGIGWATLPAVGVAAVWFRRARMRNPFIGWSILWVASAWLAVLLQQTWALRFSSIVMMPAVVIVAVVVGSMARVRHPRWLWVALPFVVVAFGANVWGQAERIGNLEWTIEETRLAVTERVGEDEDIVFIGSPAMRTLLASPYDIYFTKPGFNEAPEALRALRPTHTLGMRMNYLRRAGIRYSKPLLRRRVVHRDVLLHELTLPDPR